MKRIILFISVLTFSILSHAANTYDLSVELKLGGKVISQSNMVVEEGKEAIIETTAGSKKHTFKVEATKNSKKFKHGIQLDFEVGQFSKDGKRTIISTPQVLTLPGQEAEIMVTSKNNNEKLTLKVVAIPTSN